jgi:hypothetical protein
MTVIEIRPHPWGWKAFEAPGVEPVFPQKDQAIDYPQNRACFRSGEVRISMFRLIANTVPTAFHLFVIAESCSAVGGWVLLETSKVPSVDEHSSRKEKPWAPFY